METKYLFQALKFACLPTLSILTLLFFGFFDIAKTIEFISSDNGWAIALRVFLVIAEMLLIYGMYDYYKTEGDKKEIRERTGLTDNDKGNYVSYSTSIYHLHENWGSQCNYKAYIKSDDIVLIERVVTKK